MTTATVTLRRNSDGLERSFDEEVEAYNGAICFAWTQGNYSCDCNRHIFFERAAGVESKDADEMCGDERYTLIGVVVDGETVAKDEP